MNALKGETPLTVGEGDQERRYTLVLDHEALIAAESAYGKPLPMLMADATLGFVGASRALLYGALRAKHPEVTPAAAAALLLEHGDPVSAALAQAAEAAFPRTAPIAEGKQSARPPRAKPTGKSGGRSGVKRGSTRTRSSGQPRASSKSSSQAG